MCVKKMVYIYDISILLDLDKKWWDTAAIIANNSVALITSAWSSSGIQGLMEDVEDVNKVNYLGQTALHKAASGM